MPPAPWRSGAAAGRTPGDSEQLIADGWGYATLSPAASGGQRRRTDRRIIGLVNRGQRRKPDDWGSLRAWAWGASRGLDYLETDRAVDAKEGGDSKACRGTARRRS
jgi:hypothetical protein